MIKGQIEVTRRRGRRRKKLLDNLKDRRGYCQLKEEALDRTMWSNRFGRGFGPVVWQITDDDDDYCWRKIVPPVSVAARSKAKVCGSSLAEFVGSNPTGGTDVRLLYSVLCVLSSRGLCFGRITRPEESYRLWSFVECDLETSWMRKPWPAWSCRAKHKSSSSSSSSCSWRIRHVILFLGPQDEVGPSISSSDVLCFFVLLVYIVVLVLVVCVHPLYVL